MQKFFLYVRKSTDVEDKQVRSIEDQIAELRAFAKAENLEVIDVLIEKKSAKIPGRPIFNDMVLCIEKGEANGILAWHPDRLARNSVDGGRIIYLLDTGKLQSLKFPTFWCDSTSQGKFMLNMAFGQSKYYVDNLSENTKRGLRQKVKRGEYPSFAPIGYINDSRTKSVVVDKKKSAIIRKAFSLYSENASRLEDISHFLAQQGVRTRGGKELPRDRISFVLSNPFYIGLFRYAGEIYEGKYQPIISKKIFDKVQEILKHRGRPHHKQKNEPQPFCGLLKCGNCQMAITGEYKVKKQKNGNEHYYTYYHCTHKSKTIKCNEPCIRQEKLDEQISHLLQTFSLKKDWADEINKMLEKDRTNSAQSFTPFVQENKSRIMEISIKLQRLLDGYLEQDIDREIYRVEKGKLLSEKKSLEEKISTFQQRQTGWIEPMRNWIIQAQSLEKISNESNLFEKKVAIKEIVGSNLILQNREAREKTQNATEIPFKTPWGAVVAVRRFLGKKEKSFIVERVWGVEPHSLAWKAKVIPIYDTRARLCPWRESNPHIRLRRALFCPLNYKGQPLQLI